jgi:glycosyltransferase involved in cell wall biosynthesis
VKILHLCPLWFPVAESSLGGVESFTAALMDELGGLGFDNTLIASGDSRTSAQLVPAVETGLFEPISRLEVWEYVYPEQHQLSLAVEMAPEFDVVHSHLGPPGYVLSAIPSIASKVVHTQHNPVTPDLERLVYLRPDLPISTVSAYQACKLLAAGARRCWTIHNGIRTAGFPFRPDPTAGLVYLGRMEHEKGPDLAIAVARELDLPLALAGPIIDDGYFAETIEPLISDRVSYLGIVGGEEKCDLLGRAACALVPSRCDEGFGLVAIEAMACGTPVAALANGALPEIVEPGLTGFLSPTEEGLASAVGGAMRLDRRVIRHVVVERFDISVSAAVYADLYAGLVQAKSMVPA